MINQTLLTKLKEITPEEQQILNGEKKINSSIYQSDVATSVSKVDAKKLLETGKLITLRTHTRFIPFPAHTHNYVEVIYMCSGRTHHIINGTPLELNAGDLLFLNQNAVQEIEEAGIDDVAVNFIILPEFFDYAIQMMEPDENLLRSFVLGCLKGEHEESSYLHFKVADILPIQNLIENLIWTLVHHQANKRSINQITMGLLLLQLMNHIGLAETDLNVEKGQLTIEILRYIDEHYRDGKLNALAELLHYDTAWLSREIKRQTGNTFTELVQRKRLSQAAYLLTSTKMKVDDISASVGYENVSYFHRIFQKKYGMSPRKYRVATEDTF